MTDLAPLLGIHAAVNHSRLEERLSIPEALELFTRGVAYSSFDEDKRGQLTPGFQADITVLAENIFNTEPSTLKDIPIRMTIVDGSVVFGS